MIDKDAIVNDAIARLSGEQLMSIQQRYMAMPGDVRHHGFQIARHPQRTDVFITSSQKSSSSLFNITLCEQFLPQLIPGKGEFRIECCNRTQSFDSIFILCVTDCLKSIVNIRPQFRRCCCTEF